MTEQHPNLMLTKNFQQLKAEVESHVEADSVAQGSYNTCFIGCLANQSNDPQHIKNTYGIPEMVSRIAESIFEGLPKEEAPAFFGALPNAVACDGKDLSRVPWQFLAAELESLPTMPDSIQAVIDPVIAGMKLLAEGKEWGEASANSAAWAAARAANSAANSAARAAASAANSAARAANSAAASAAARAANSAAWAADSAADSAAWAAAWAADSAAWDAASAVDARRRQRDLLLKLISEAPVIAVEGE